jgi:ankyrin repeat protein
MQSFSLRKICVLGAVVAMQGGCAMAPEQLAYRDRLEMGFLTPEDQVRFKTPDVERLALESDANDPRPGQAQPFDTALMQAAAAGDMARIKILMDQGALVNAMDPAGNTPLLFAARENQINAARVLLKAGADVNGRSGSTPPLAAAALRGHVFMVRLLLRNQAHVNRVGANDLTALMNAVELNRLDVVQVLLEAGANTRVLNRAGENVLAVAVRKNNPALLDLLLKQGVAPDMADSNGLTALYWAQYFRRDTLAQMLIDAGAQPDKRKAELVVSRPYSLGEN